MTAIITEGGGQGLNGTAIKNIFLFFYFRGFPKIKIIHHLIFFRPDPSVNSLFGDEYHGSLADDLATLSVDTVLYQVYALDQPNGSEELIGNTKESAPFPIPRKKCTFGDFGIIFIILSKP